VSSAAALLPAQQLFPELWMLLERRADSFTCRPALTMAGQKRCPQEQADSLSLPEYFKNVVFKGSRY
jgi:hypothetical protein